jgi:hypothetical protein
MLASSLLNRQNIRFHYPPLDERTWRVWNAIYALQMAGLGSEPIRLRRVLDKR